MQSLNQILQTSQDPASQPAPTALLSGPAVVYCGCIFVNILIKFMLDLKEQGTKSIYH